MTTPQPDRGRGFTVSTVLLVLSIISLLFAATIVEGNATEIFGAGTAAWGFLGAAFYVAAQLPWRR